MTQEDKELLLKDICSRLPYGVKIELSWWDMGKWTYIDTTLEADHIKHLINDDIEIEPYLFPLSSMTEKQKKYINDRWNINENFDFEIDPNWGKYFVDLGDVVDYINWLNKNHFDYRGLIEKGLAIDATELNIY